MLFQSPVATLEFIMLISGLVLGLSHLLQPKMWIDYFDRLATSGHPGVVTNIMSMHLVPALLIVAFHQVWHGPGIVLTIYGHILLFKSCVHLLRPEIGLRSLEMARRHGTRGFKMAAGMLIFVALMSGLALYGQGIRG